MGTNSKGVRVLFHVIPNPLTHIQIQKLPERPQKAVPTTEYIKATGKQGLLLLQSAGALIPVPLIQDVIGVALKIIEVCEVCKIRPRKGCEMILKILSLSECICSRGKGQRAARQSILSVIGYRPQCYIKE